MKASAQFYSIAFFAWISEIQPRSIHSSLRTGSSYQEPNRFTATAEELKTSERAADEKEKQTIWIYVVNALVAKENGHRLPFWILSLQTLYYLTC